MIQNDDTISRQAAIDAFYEMASDIDHLCTVGDYVHVLDGLPSAQPKVDCQKCIFCGFAGFKQFQAAQSKTEEQPATTVQNVPKDDLISRKAAIEALDHMDYMPGEWAVNGLTMCKDAIKALPSTQPEIIHCKECKFYTEMRPDLNIGICSLACRHLGGDGFCSEAERRTDE